jgi:hypothetical protein
MSFNNSNGSGANVVMGTMIEALLESSETLVSRASRRPFAPDLRDLFFLAVFVFAILTISEEHEG